MNRFVLNSANFVRHFISSLFYTHFPQNPPAKLSNHTICISFIIITSSVDMGSSSSSSCVLPHPWILLFYHDCLSVGWSLLRWCVLRLVYPRAFGRLLFEGRQSTVSVLALLVEEPLWRHASCDKPQTIIELLVIGLARHVSSAAAVVVVMVAVSVLNKRPTTQR